jgi:Xaa-Pro aminopeptidase
MTGASGLTDKELFPRFTDEEYARRYRAIREAMQRENLDAILISGARGSSEVHYLSNYLAQSPCWLLFPREGAPTVFIHFFNHQPCAKAQSVIEDVRWYGPSPIEAIVEEIRRRDLAQRKIGIVSLRTIGEVDVGGEHGSHHSAESDYTRLSCRPAARRCRARHKKRRRAVT